jgi:hypothetical protein
MKRVRKAVLKQDSLSCVHSFEWLYFQAKDISELSKGASYYVFPLSVPRVLLGVSSCHIGSVYRFT